MVDFLKGLNAAQREAVLANDGPLLILAGAGSGKTRALTAKVAWLILKEGVPPDRLIAMTFTNKAAGEMKKRVGRILGYSPDGLWIGTFHSLFARILRRHAAKLGYDSNFTIYDREDSLQTIKTILVDRGLQNTYKPRDVLWQTVALKNLKALHEEDFVIPDDSDIFEKIYRDYEEALLRSNAMDFDDLLIKPLRLFNENEDIAEYYKNKFQYLLIDEFQDTNRIQFELAKILVGAHKRICAVGDEDQSIYGWRGASIDNILSFGQVFPGAKVIKLETNYRSYNPILALASSVVEKNSSRIGKNLEAIRGNGELPVLIECADGRSEAAKIVNLIFNARVKEGYNFGDIAVLYRTNSQSRPLEEALMRNGISYEIVGGTKFFERKEIKDAIAYLRFLINGNDRRAFERIASVPKKGLGEKTLRDITSYALSKGTDIFSALKEMSKEKRLKGKVAEAVDALIKNLEFYRAKNKNAPTGEWAGEYLRDVGLVDFYRKEDEQRARGDFFSGNATARTDNLDILIDSIHEYGKTSGDDNFDIGEFLQQVQLQSEVDEWNESPQKVTLMTIHQSKGLEFPVVIIAGLEQGILPLSRNFERIEKLEEERRLFYVAATRAMDRLYMTYAKKRFRHGALMPALPSQFINEMNKELLVMEADNSFYGKRQSSNNFQSEVSASSDSAQASDEPYYDYSDNQLGGRDFRIGMEVSHPKYGKGKVLNVEGFGNFEKITVLFYDENFSKKLLKKYAKLTVISE